MGIVQSYKDCPRWRGGRVSLEAQLAGGRSPRLPGHTVTIPWEPIRTEGRACSSHAFL